MKSISLIFCNGHDYIDICNALYKFDERDSSGSKKEILDLTIVF